MIASTIIHELAHAILAYHGIGEGLQHQEMVANQLKSMENALLEMFPGLPVGEDHALSYEGLDETIYDSALKSVFPMTWNSMVDIMDAHREGKKGTRCP